MRSSVIKFAGSVIVVMGFAFLAAYQLLAVDACLDSGGSFDYARGVCDSHATPAVQADRPEEAGPAA